MTQQEAFKYISDGHTLWTVECAKEVCKAFGVPFEENLVAHYKGQKDANPNNDYKGLWLKEDKPTDGVNSLALSNYIAVKILNTQSIPSGEFYGRGSGARANAESVRRHLNL